MSDRVDALIDDHHRRALRDSEVGELIAEIRDSRAREAKLVEALREAVMCARHGGLPLIDFNALLALYDTPAEMPADCHPQGE